MKLNTGELDKSSYVPDTLRKGSRVNEEKTHAWTWKVRDAWVWALFSTKRRFVNGAAAAREAYNQGEGGCWVVGWSEVFIFVSGHSMIMSFDKTSLTAI